MEPYQYNNVFYLYLQRIIDLERELEKLRNTLETQQDAALQRLNSKDTEWKALVEKEQLKVTFSMMYLSI